MLDTVAEWAVGWTRGGEVLVQALALVTRSQGLSPPFALKSNKSLSGKVEDMLLGNTRNILTLNYQGS